MSEKVLTFVEVELDAFRATQFEEARDGEVFPRWAAQPGVVNLTVLGVDQPAFPSGKGLSVTRSVPDLESLVFWDWPDPGPRIRDASVVTLQRVPAGSTIGTSIVLRGQQTPLLNGYRFHLDGTSAHILKSINSVDTFMSSIPFALTTEQNVWMRFDTINLTPTSVLLRGKMWFGKLADEPKLFQIYAIDDPAQFTTENFVGLRGQSGAEELQIGYFRVRSLFGNLPEVTRYSVPTNYLPHRLITSIPIIRGVSFSASEISPGGSLGKRSRVTVTLADSPDTDLGEFLSNGTRLGRFRGRGLFRRGAPLRYIRGTLGQSLGDMERRHFTLESFSGPSRDGSLVFVAQDLLKFADSDRSQAPRMSNGSLLAAIDATQTNATLSPAGIGNEEYPTSGIANLGGSEVVTFTRVGDSLTLTRGQHGTVGVTHNAQDRVQLCLYYQAKSPAFIIHHLLTEYTDTSPDVIPLADWEEECASHLGIFYTQLITEPTGVKKHLEELIVQAGLSLWADEIENKIRLQVLRGVDEDSFIYDETNTIKGSINSQEQPSKTITQVWTYYGVKDPLKSLSEANNYRSSLRTIASEFQALSGQAIIKKVFANWIPEFGQMAAQRVNSIHISRFAGSPRRFTFSTQRDSGIVNPEMGASCRLAWAENQGELESNITAPAQIISVTPRPDRFEVVAEEMLFNAVEVVSSKDRVITIDSPINSIFLPNLYQSIFPPPTPQEVSDGVNLTVIIASNVVVGSIGDFFAFNVGTSSFWPTGFPIKVIIQPNARIQGRGGNGGRVSSELAITAPVSGGHALETDVPISLENFGHIWSGGGGGGVGLNLPIKGGMGGGGSGTPPGLGGSSTISVVIAGQDGTGTAGGLGGSNEAVGGAGGNPGNAGASGAGTQFAQAGAASGIAIRGNALITYLTAGDILGPVI